MPYPVSRDSARNRAHLYQSLPGRARRDAVPIARRLVLTITVPIVGLRAKPGVTAAEHLIFAGEAKSPACEVRGLRARLQSPCAQGKKPCVQGSEACVRGKKPCARSSAL